MKKQITTTDVERFNPDINSGLNSQQVDLRNTQKLTNLVKKSNSKSYLSIFLSNFFTFFNFLGLVVVIALLAISAPLSNYFFAVIFASNIAVGIIQEIRAKRCIDRLSIMANNNAKVIREGNEIEIPSSNIVLDDIVVLGLGDQIPADGIILDGEIEVNESFLTGESIAIRKKINDKIFAGSFITSGHCIYKATSVGANNYVEKLSAKAKQYKKPHSEIMRALRTFIRIIGIAIIPIATFFMLKTTLIHGESIKIAIERTSTVVIGMIPSGMFLLTSVALAVGVIKLARHKTLVQDLYSLEMLARVDTICFDKTGTITDGNMTVNKIVKISQDFDVNFVMKNVLGALNDNNQTFVALSNYFGHDLSLNVIESLAFNSKNKYSAVSFENEGTFIFGASNYICKNLNKDVQDQIEEYSKDGLRVLLLAHSNSVIKDCKIPTDATPVALLLLADHIREDAFDTVRWFNDNDVKIKVISGDNPLTVSEVAKRVGIPNADRYISLEDVSDDEIFEIAENYTVFGRVSPDQKALLVKALKAKGHTTAMTGDGVNDILAMKESDCAVSVASGTEAARNLSNIILMDNNFNSMPNVVYEGRRVINNVQSSSSLFLMKTFFTFLVAILTLCSPAETVYPFTLSNMILLEVCIIGLPSFFLSFQPNKERVQGDFISQVISKSIPGATLIFFGVLFTTIFKYIYGVNAILTEDIYSTIMVFLINLAGLINLFNVCKPLNKYRGILFSINFVVVVGVSIFAATQGLEMFNMHKLLPLNNYWIAILIIVGISLIEIPLSLLLNRIFRNLNLKKVFKKV